MGTMLKMDTVKQSAFIFDVEVEFECPMKLSEGSQEHLVPIKAEGLVIARKASGEDAPGLLALGEIIERYGLDAEVKKYGLEMLAKKYVTNLRTKRLNSIGQAHITSEWGAE